MRVLSGRPVFSGCATRRDVSGAKAAPGEPVTPLADSLRLCFLRVVCARKFQRPSLLTGLNCWDRFPEGGRVFQIE